MTAKTALKQTNCPSLLWIMPISIIFIVFSVRSLFELKVNVPESIGVLDFATINLIQVPVEEFEVINRREECGEGFKPLLTSYWPGTVPGCYENGELSSNSDSCDGTELPRKDPIELYSWGDYEFCAKYLEDYDYVAADEECGSNQRKCSEGLCTNKDSKCPITSIQLVETNDGDEDSSYVDFETKMLKISRKQDESPFTILDVINGKLCYSYFARGKSTSFYPILDVDNGCGDWGSTTNYHELSTRSEENYYKDNLLQYVFTELPKYEDYLRDILSLISVNQIDFTKSSTCVNSVKDLEEAFAYEPTSKFPFRTMKMVTIIIVEGLIVLYCIDMLVIFINTKFPTRSHNINLIGCIVVMVLSCIGTMIASKQVNSLAVEANTNRLAFETLSSNKCFADDTFNDAIAHAVDFLAGTAYQLQWQTDVMFYGQIVRAVGVIVVMLLRRSPPPDEDVKKKDKTAYDRELYKKMTRANEEEEPEDSPRFNQEGIDVEEMQPRNRRKPKRYY